MPNFIAARNEGNCSLNWSMRDFSDQGIPGKFWENWIAIGGMNF